MWSLSLLAEGKKQQERKQNGIKRDTFINQNIYTQTNKQTELSFRVLNYSALCAKYSNHYGLGRLPTPRYQNVGEAERYMYRKIIIF